MINPVGRHALAAGYSMLFSWFFFKRVRRHWVKALLALYPLAMAFTLMYGGEHYFIDLLAGWLLAIFAVEVSDRFPTGASVGLAKAQRRGEIPAG